MIQDFAKNGIIGRDDRQACVLRFEQRQAQTFFVGGADECVGVLKDLVDALGRLVAMQDHAGASLKDAPIVAPASAPGVRVLLAEDNPINALLARTLLEREGCKVDRVAGGDQAVAALSSNSYDLILMDLRMPGLNGVDATRALRAQGVTAPIVALTADAFDEDRRACLAAGMDDFLVKPLTHAALRDVLTRWTGPATRPAGWTKAATRAKVAG